MNEAPREPLAVEMLIPEEFRRITVEEHQAFRRSIATPPAFDQIDIEAAGEQREETP